MTSNNQWLIKSTCSNGVIRQNKTSCKNVFDKQQIVFALRNIFGIFTLRWSLILRLVWKSCLICNQFFQSVVPTQNTTAILDVSAALYTVNISRRCYLLQAEFHNNLEYSLFLIEHGQFTSYQNISKSLMMIMMMMMMMMMMIGYCVWFSNLLQGEPFGFASVSCYFEVAVFHVPLVLLSSLPWVMLKVVISQHCLWTHF